MHGHAVGVRAHLDRDVRHRRVRAHDGLDAEVVVEPLIEVDRVREVVEVERAVVLLGGVAPEHDAQELHGVFLRRGDQAVARGVRVAGLDAGCGLVEVVRVHDGVRVNQPVRVLQHARVAQVRRGDGIAERVADRLEQRVLQRLLRDQPEIRRRRVVVVVRHAVRVHEVRPRAAELGRAVVHALHKGVDAAGQMRADHVARLVRRGDHRAVEVLLKGHRLARLDARRAGFLVQTLARVAAGGDLIRKLHLAPVERLEREQHGHDLRQTRGVGLLVGVAGVVRLPGFEIAQQRAPRVDIRRGLRLAAGGVVRRGVRGECRHAQRERQAHNQQKQNRLRFSHGFLHRSVIYYNSTGIARVIILFLSSKSK